MPRREVAAKSNRCEASAMPAASSMRWSARMRTRAGMRSARSPPANRASSAAMFAGTS